MKTLFQNKLRYSYLEIFVFILTISFSLSSCLKDSGPDSSSIVSALTVINASPNSPTLEFVLDNQRVQEFSYPDERIKYFAAFSGSPFARIYEAGKFNYSLYELELNLVQRKYYSLFIGGKKEALTSIMLEDEMTIPPTGSAKIRFINLSPDAPALNFQISADSILASNKKFKEYTSFQEVKVGNYSAVIKSHDGRSVNLPIDLKIEDRRVYTIWARGLISTTIKEEAIGSSLIVHNID